MFLLASLVLAGDWHELRTDSVRASSFLQDDARTRPKLVYAWSHHVGEEREAFDYKDEAVYAYDAAGHLRSVYEPERAPVFGQGLAHLVEYTWDAGKITMVVETEGPIGSTADTCSMTETRF